MRRYGQFCPVAKTAEIFCQRWNALIIRDLSWGSTRFSDLKRGVPLMSPTLLAERLRTLEAEGVVERRGSSGGRSTYHLTEAGQELIPMIEAMGVWGQRWTRRDLPPEEIDVDLLLWGIEANARYDAFGRVPFVVRLEFSDEPKHKRFWWYLMNDGRCQLCIDDPGHDVDLFVSSDVPAMIRVYRGDVPVSRAVDAGLVDLHGTREDQDAFGMWLNLSPLAAVRSRREDTPVS